MLIELYGPPGVGKSSLLSRFLSSFNSMVYGIVFPNDGKKEPFTPPLWTIAAGLKQTDNNSDIQLDKFVNFCIDSISRNSMNAYQKLIAIRYVETSVTAYKKLKPKSDYGYAIISDELLLQRALSFLQYSSDFEDDVRTFYNLVPLPEAVCFCKAPPAVILNRLLGRQRQVNVYRGKNKEEKANLTKKSLEVCEMGEKILRERGVKVLSLDLSKDKELYCDQLKDFVIKIRDEYKESLFNRLIEASGNIRSVSRKGERHVLVNQGVAYCSFRTPQFTVSARQSERSSEKRFERFEITDYHLQGKTVLDLGSNCGAMLFQASNYGIKQGVGIEYDRDKVVLANQIAALSNLQHIAFFQGDIDELSYEKTGKFDVVFALASEAHVRDFEHLLKFLSEITEEVLYFEGNSNCDIKFVDTKLKEFGFKKVKYLGFCDDDIRPQNNNRPMFKAIKNSQIKEMQNLIKKVLRLNSRLQDLLKLGNNRAINQKIESISDYAINKFITARLDIKNFGTDGNSVEVIEISDKTVKVQSPGWFKNAQGQGIVIQSTKGDIRLKIKCIGNGALEIVLRGVDFRDKNSNRVPVWIDFKRLNVNNKNIFTGSHVVCHDKPFKHRFHVADGETVTLDVAWWRAVDNTSE